MWVLLTYVVELLHKIYLKPHNFEIWEKIYH